MIEMLLFVSQVAIYFFWTSNFGFSVGELLLERTSGIGEPEYLHSAERVASQRARLTGANKRMLNLLRKAKVQLIKIDQQKQLKSSGVRLRV